ncbi:MAG: hypothetical protein HY072_08565 [Deltaproteobacteria bacterium]|nr:hypothetical protein [Deltaproteobacteria bacterium]
MAKSKLISYQICIQIFFTVYSIVNSKVFANSSIEIKSLYGGDIPYEIVYADPKGTDTRAPGVYLLKNRGDSPLAIGGDVLGAGRNFNGILLQSTISSRGTNKQEALAVVDGKLTLFSNKTNPKNNKTKVVFGSKNTPLIDILNQKEIILSDPIESRDDISIFSSGYHQKIGEIILVSIRKTHQLGNGYTFAFRINSST